MVGASRDRIVIHRPVAYQEFSGARRKVASSYRMLGRSGVGVEVASYDRSKPLTIDPTVSYATFLGGSFIDEADALAVNSTGSAYITGFTCSADFPIAPGTSVPQPGFGGLCDAFVTKLSPDGHQLLYSTYLGGGGADRGNGIAVNQSGAVYVTGTTSGHFPVTAGAAQTAYGGGSSDAFVSKISAGGSTLIYSTYLGGEAIESGQAIAVPQGCLSSCDAFAVGYTLSFRFPATAGAFQTANGGTGDASDAFIARVNSSGTGLKYASYLGGHEGDGAFAVAVDSAGDAYVGGVTDAIGGNNFPITTASAAQKVFGGTADGFVAKINPTGTAPLIYSTYLGGSGFDSVLGIAIDSSGAAYVTGMTSSADFPTTAGAFQGTFGGGSGDGFITKLAAGGASLVYSSYLGGSGNDIGRAIALDSTGNAYINGNTSSSDFPAVSPVQAIPAPNGQLVISRNDGETFSASGLNPSARLSQRFGG